MGKRDAVGGAPPRPLVSRRNHESATPCRLRPNSTLREHIRAQAEIRPGVYRMYGPGDELLYVGKSVHMRTRLLSYFRASRGEKAWELINQAGRVSWEYIPNELAALIHEMKLIQKWHVTCPSKVVPVPMLDLQPSAVPGVEAF
jgi:hypothetical protein